MEHTPLSINEAMKKFVAGIKTKYKEKRINREKQWPPCKSEKLVRLELVETERIQDYSAIEQRGRESKVTVRRTPLDYPDLFKVEKGEKPVKKILVEGDAGIGKTTLCTALSEEWSNEHIFQEFELLLLLPLREKIVASAGSFLDLLNLLHPNHKICDLVEEYFEEDEGKILIIADGWDELGKEKREEGSFLYNVLFGELYNSISTLVTSRPSASASLRSLPCIDQFAEVRGFDKEHIVEYINSEFSMDQEKASNILEKLENNPLIESICSVPLNCAIICHLWRTLKGDLPTTMTGLYTQIIFNIILRNIHKFPAYEAITNLSTFDDLPEALQQTWWLLCEFAFQTLQKDQLVFSDKELRSFFPQGLNDILCFGLMQSSVSSLGVGCGRSFHFLHLTFQEYLAALFLVKRECNLQVTDSSSLNISRLATLFKVKQESHSQITDSSGQIILRFFFGIVFETFRSSLGQRILDMFANKLLTHELEALALCHWAFEAHNDKFVHIVANIIGGDYPRPRTLHDFAAVVYMIANTPQYTDKGINFSNCGLHDIHITALTDALSNKDGKLQVRRLDLRGNKLTDRGVTELFDRASAAFQSLDCLDLGENRIEGECINSVLATLANPFCVEVELSLKDNPLEIMSLTMFRDALCCIQLTSLTELHLKGSLSSDADTNAEFIIALGHCHNLKVLNLSGNNLHVPGGRALGKLIPQLSLKELNVSNAVLGDEGMAALTQCLHGTCHVGELYLMDNNIQADGISCLADSICAGRIVIESTLHLRNNLLCLEGAVALVELISSKYFQACNVYLDGCRLTTVGGDNTHTVSPNFDKSITCVGIREWICSQEIKSNSIEVLSLGSISFTGVGIHLLAGFMYLCPYLRSLYCNKCEITSNDLKLLLSLVSLPNSNLEKWHLWSNNIDDDGVSGLIERLPLFPSLTRIDVEFNHTSPEMFINLKKICEKRCKVRRAVCSSPFLKHNLL